MSIIYDALKKVEKDFGQEQYAKDEPLVLAPIKNRFYLKGVFFYIAVGLIGFYTAKAIFSSLPAFSGVKPKAEELKLAKPPRQAQPFKAINNPLSSIFHNPPAETSKQETGVASYNGKQFVLNGVFFSEGKGFALINNRILEEGDSIDGAAIEKITMEEVYLKSGDTPLKLFTSAQN